MVQAVVTTVLFAMSAVSAGRSTRLLGAGVANLSRLALATIFLALWAHTAGQGIGGVALPWLLASGVIGFGLVLAAGAYLCRYFEGVLWFAFQILSVTGGSLLGVFLLGLLTRRRGNLGNVIAMVASAAAMAALLVLSQQKIVPIGWTWLIAIGTGMTFVLGYALSFVSALTPQAASEAVGCVSRTVSPGGD